VYTQSYAAPVIQALKEAGRPMVPVVSWSYNSSFKAMAENECDGAVIHNGPGISAEAMVMAVNILEGTKTYPTDEEIASTWYLYVANGDTAKAASLSCNYEVIEENVNWWPDLAPGLQNPNVADWVGVTVPIEAIG
jgi:ribose transport system substrate-binding protein